MAEYQAIDHRIKWLGVSLCVISLAYFYVLDRVFFSSASFSPIFKFLLRRDEATAWFAAAVAILAMFWNRPAPILRLVDSLNARAPWVALMCVMGFALGAIIVYHDYPLSMDEYAAVFQSKIFASGHLTGRLPPAYVDWMMVRGFNGEFFIASRESGTVIEKFWPGFALLIAAFEFVHVRWLCNALLSGVALLLIRWITLEITQDKRAAGWAMLFAIASGAFVADGISYYSMQAHLTANLLFAALLLRPSRYRAFGAGLVGSLALILHNPVPHALFAIPWLTALTWDRRQRRYLAPLLFGYLPGFIVGFGWIALRLDIASEAHKLSGFGGITNGVFTWPNVAILNKRAASLVKMWIWAAPCVFLIAVLGFARCRESLSVRLLASSALVTFAAYFFVTFDQGHGWGNRYFHSAWGVIPILAACAMTGKSGVNLRLVSFVGAAAALNLFVIVPFQLNQIHGFLSQHLAQLASPRRPGNNVYLIHPRDGFYVADMVQIDPYLRDPDLYLVSRGAELDLKMILNNWPDAVHIESRRSYDQWYLGPDEHRRAMHGNIDTKRFELLEPSD